MLCVPVSSLCVMLCVPVSSLCVMLCVPVSSLCLYSVCYALCSSLFTLFNGFDEASPQRLPVYCSMVKFAGRASLMTWIPATLKQVIHRYCPSTTVILPRYYALCILRVYRPNILAGIHVPQILGALVPVIRGVHSLTPFPSAAGYKHPSAVINTAQCPYRRRKH